MKPKTKALLAALTVLSLTQAGFAQVSTVPPLAPKVESPAVQVEYEEEEEGWFGLFGHDKGDHGGKHGGHRRGGHDDDGDDERGDDGDDDGDDDRGEGERGEDNDRGAAAAPCAQDAQGACKPPANGLFQNGTAPKAQTN
ncbi:hypothetical protein NX862_14960 [Rhodobacter sp. KR11]|uniref:hypothetical protein n=1 Tax=Rhodobacter sp. KR11 TaxID=2974588 RepID=UPI00222151C3|nr:hypothetical protein [Rhodobacter sp. KR11]MCW1920058.1 hypothetical protein [Rhodobacter sp. KR11]